MRLAIERTFTALNDRGLEEFLAHLAPGAQELWFGGGGARESSEQQWRAFLANVVDIRLQPRQIRTRILGNVAATTAHLHGTIRFTWGGVEGGPWRYSETRIREDGQWRIVQMHLSPLLHNLGQVPAGGFRPGLTDPAFPGGAGPLVLIDEGHYEQHTAWSTYGAMADLLRRDGYVVSDFSEPLSRETLAAAKILVMGNPMSASIFANQGASPQPAFTQEEIRAVREWVNAGGALLLLTGHNPYPLTIRGLAEAFGIEFWNCGAVYPGSRSGRLMFRRGEPSNLPGVVFGGDSVSYGAGGRLMPHAVTAGIDSIATFMGSAFHVGGPHIPILVFGPTVECWDEKDLVGRPEGRMQAAVLEFGKGRVAVFGNAGLFASQLSTWTGYRTGMNNPIAKQNPLLLRKVMHWLTEGQ